MASIYRPTVIRYVDAQGRQVAKKTPGAKRVREKSKTFRGRYRSADGKQLTISLCEKREDAETMFAKIVERAKREARGDFDRFEIHRNRPITEHLDDFESALLAREATSKQASQAKARCRKIIDACRFKLLSDLSPSAIATYLRERRGATKKNLSVQTSNHYLAAIKAFANWLVKDQRIPANPLTHLGRLNPKVDIRRERRRLTGKELAGLIHSTEQSKESFRGLSGPTRAMLYRVAALTGIRASELASLTPASFDFAADPPTVTIEASYSKRRRKDILPIHADLAVSLREWLKQAERQRIDERQTLSISGEGDSPREKLFPNRWPEKAANMLRIDLAAADILYLTDEGYADFHSLRHTFVSNLVTGGAHPKVAQQLARHSTITLTMDRYSHLSLVDMTAGLSVLANITAPMPEEHRATGTTGDASGLSCTISCNAPAEINGLQPFSTVQSLPDNPADDSHITLPMKALCEPSKVHPAGLEPATFGSVDRLKPLRNKGFSEEVAPEVAIDTTANGCNQLISAAQTNQGLMRVISAWPNLPKHIKAAVLSLIVMNVDVDDTANKRSEERV